MTKASRCVSEKNIDVKRKCWILYVAYLTRYINSWTIVWMQERQLQGNAAFKSSIANNSAKRHSHRPQTSPIRCIKDPSMNGFFFQTMRRMMMHILANGRQPCLKSNNNSNSIAPQISHPLLHPLLEQHHPLTTSFPWAMIHHFL